MASGWTLAIDFGTTRTSAAILSEGKVDLIELEGQTSMPSAVLADGDALVAGAAADDQRIEHPERLERNPKRFLGQWDHLVLDGRQVRTVEAVAAVLRAVYTEARQRRDGTTPDVVRLTHPARWGRSGIEALAEAARLAGMRSFQFLAEPAAAALGHVEANIGVGDHVAVYDLGGGTFDVAVLRRSEHGFVLAGPPGGNDRLGGEYLDHRLATHLRAQLAAIDPDLANRLASPTDRPWQLAALTLLSEAHKAKEALSSQTSYTVHLPAPVDRELRVTRPDLEALVRSDLTKTVEELTLTIRRAGLRPEDLAAVYLTGGCSRIPLVASLVRGAYPQVLNPEDPKGVVALGAARADAIDRARASDTTVRQTIGAAVVPVGPAPLPPPAMTSTRQTVATVAVPVGPASRQPTGHKAARGRRRALACAAAAIILIASVAVIVSRSGDDDSSSTVLSAAQASDSDGKGGEEAGEEEQEGGVVEGRSGKGGEDGKAEGIGETTTTTTTTSTTTAAPTTTTTTGAPPTTSPPATSPPATSPPSPPGTQPPPPPPTTVPGPALVTVPNLIGSRLQAAIASVQAVGLGITWPDHCDDVVTTQTPAAGSKVSPGSNIDVDLVPCIVPNVIGMRLNDAIASLDSVTLSTSWPAYCDDVVTAQNPAGGTLVAPYSTVYLTLVPC